MNQEHSEPVVKHFGKDLAELRLGRNLDRPRLVRWQWHQRRDVAGQLLVPEPVVERPTQTLVGHRHSANRVRTAEVAIFAARGHMSTQAVLAGLTSLDEAPWTSLNGEQLDSRRLANLLREYGVSSKDVRIEKKVVKGYARKDLNDAWSRYLPAASSPSRKDATSATSATGIAPDTPQGPLP